MRRVRLQTDIAILHVQFKRQGANLTVCLRRRSDDWSTDFGCWLVLGRPLLTCSNVFSWRAPATISFAFPRALAMISFTPPLKTLQKMAHAVDLLGICDLMGI